MTASSQEIAGVAFIVFEWEWEIKWIDSLSCIDTDIEIAPSDSINEIFVFIFRIYDDHIMTEHETTEYLEFDGKWFTSSWLREDDHIGIFCAETVVDNEWIVVRVLIP
jgi:hypothetical protein